MKKAVEFINEFVEASLEKLFNEPMKEIKKKILEQSWNNLGN